MMHVHLGYLTIVAFRSYLLSLMEHVVRMSFAVHLSFPIVGTHLPLDYAYPLFSAMSHAVPELHDTTDFRVGPISSLINNEPNRLTVTSSSRLQVRIPCDQIPTVLRLSNASLLLLDLATTANIRLGVPSAYPIVPLSSLYARAVYIKPSGSAAITRTTFFASARRQLADRRITCTIAIPGSDEFDAHDPSRRVLRVHSNDVIGYSLVLSDLSALDSIRLQSEGLGGRGHYGGGFFTMSKGPR